MRHAHRRRLLENAGTYHLAAPGNLARLADVDRNDVHDAKLPKKHVSLPRTQREINSLRKARNQKKKERHFSCLPLFLLSFIICIFLWFSPFWAVKSLPVCLFSLLGSRLGKLRHVNC